MYLLALEGRKYLTTTNYNQALCLQNSCKQCQLKARLIEMAYRKSWLQKLKHTAQHRNYLPKKIVLFYSLAQVLVRREILNTLAVFVRTF